MAFSGAALAFLPPSHDQTVFPHCAFMDRRRRLFHAGARHDDRQHRPALDRPQPGCAAARDAVDRGRLHADDGAPHARLGLARRPLRHAARLLRRDSAVRDRFALLRGRAYAEPTDPRARAAGHRRLDAAADRPACRAAQRDGRSLRLRARRHFDRRTGRPDSRPDARRLVRRIDLVALDLPHQRADRRARPARGASLLAERRHRRCAAVRFRRLRLAVALHGLVLDGARQPGRDASRSWSRARCSQ